MTQSLILIFQRQTILRLIFLSLIVCSLSVLSASAQSLPDRRFGAIEAFRDPVAAAEASVGWERILFYWSELQPSGPDDWNGYHVPDRWLSQAAAAGREVVGLLKSTPAWATDGPALCGVPRGLDLPIDDPGNLWAAFVRRVAGTYAGQIDHWIIWNEPDIQPGTFGTEWCGTMEEYYRLLKVAYLAAHQANPDVTILLAASTTWHDPTYLQSFLSTATQDPEGAEHGYFFDVIPLHIYFRPETIPEIFGATHATLAAFGLQKPIWLNETNAPSNADPPYWELPEANFDISLEEQASYLLQSFALALSSGAQRIAVYKWMDSEPQPGVEPFGLIRLDYSRRPAFDAYKLITTHYAGTLSAHWERQALYNVVTLDRGALTTRVLWARTASDVTVSVPALAPQARLIDQAGGEQTIEPTNGVYALTLPGARCADKRGCIIGGPTYLLVEENGGTPLPVEPSAPPPTEIPLETPLPNPTEVPTATRSAPSPTPLPTATPTNTSTPSPVPTSTSTPTATPSPTPTSTSTPVPTPSPTPVPPTPTPTLQLPDGSDTISASSWTMLISMGIVIFFAAVVGTLFRYRGR